MDKRFLIKERVGMDRGSRGFPQEEEFSTESYPQVWITLGIRPFHGAGGKRRGVDIL